jgi:hypothetical protein
MAEKSPQSCQIIIGRAPQRDGLSDTVHMSDFDLNESSFSCGELFLLTEEPDVFIEILESAL